MEDNPGVTTANALRNPERVPPKYPGATIGHYSTGNLKYVYDGPLGISFCWVQNTYSNTFYIFVEVFPPSCRRGS